jgi:hypothetical protein
MADGRKDPIGRSELAFVRARFGKIVEGLPAVFLWALVAACAGNHDASSREIFSMVHLSATPTGSLSLSDDRSYEFLDSSSKSQRKGSLSQSEFDSLTHGLSRDALEALYSHEEASAEACTKDADGYVLNTKVGSACLVTRNVSDPNARAILDSLVALFDRIAASP